ncbi:MAG: STAS domain-containing protein, partial [Planctomycetes bacterium]|nr:STAS domain-containing protein [Planctomycetota bacterium]
VLSAVVFLIGVDLLDLKGMRQIYSRRRSEFWVALITALMVVFVGVEQGILLAIVLSLIVHTRRGYRPRNAVLVPAESGTWHPQPVTSGAQAMPGLIIYRFTHSMYYANSQQLAEEVSRLIDTADPPLRWFCIDASAVDDIDYTAAETLRTILSTFRIRGIRLAMSQVLDEVKAESRCELRDVFGEIDFYDTLEDVVTEYRQQLDRGAWDRNHPEEDGS